MLEVSSVLEMMRLTAQSAAGKFLAVARYLEKVNTEKIEELEDE